MPAPLRCGLLQRGVACCPSLRWHYPDQVLSVGGDQLGHPLSPAFPSSRCHSQENVNHIILCKGYSIRCSSPSREQFSPGGRRIFAKSSQVFQRATTRVAPTCGACSAGNVGATLVVALPICKNPTPSHSQKSNLLVP
jgi:hypothetical protein